jgi:type IV fimbrial biogenesis protein FimT
MKPIALQRGLSLIEIVVAIAIIALVIGFGAPSAMTWIQNLQVRNAADSVLGGLQSARLEALRRNTMVAFEFTDANSTAWHTCIFDQVAQACTPGDLRTSTPGGQANARVGVEYQFTDFSTALDGGLNIPALVAFDQFGRIAPASGTNIARVDVRNPSMNLADERRLSIQIQVAGEMRMCDPQISKALNPQGCQ